VLIDHVSLALAAIDKLDISKGEHVAVIGGGFIGLLISMLIIYYQGVPILIDGKESNLDRARLAGVYYNLFSDNRLEKEVCELTGAHMAQKVIYVTDSNINTDVALKLASHNAKVGFVGFSSPNLKVNFNVAMKKQLEFCCITNGYGYTEQAINMLANKAIDLGIFKINTVKYDGCSAEIKTIAKNIKDGLEESALLLIDMM
jgi:threonine dehydrogenase-like Zn-dependent dehydrogenase